MKRLKRDDGGYTIAEMVIVMFVLMAVLAAVLPWLYTNLSASIRTQGRLDSVEQSRAALRQLARELRQATTITGAVDRPSGKNSISFQVDLDGNGTINPCDDTTLPPECITYIRVGGNDLIRGRKKDAGNIIASNVTTFELTYFGNDPRFDVNGDGILTVGPPDNELADAISPFGVPDDLTRVSMISVTMGVLVRNQTVVITQNVGLRNLNKLAQSVP